MKAADIVTQLCVRLPQLSDKFTNSIPIVSITRNVTLMTVQCDEPHGMLAGQAVAITNTDAPIEILNFSRVGTVATLETTTNHDLTSPDPINKPMTLTISGGNGPSVVFNGTFPIINVDNRKTIRITVDDSGPTSHNPIFGILLLHEAESLIRDYNSTFNVESVPSPTSFTFVHPITGLVDPVAKVGLTMMAETNPRISSGIDIDRIVESYTAQKQDDLWLWVVLGNVDASQSRNIDSDALDNQQRNVNYRQQIVETFSLFVFIPVAQEIAAREARDEISDLLRPILRSLLFSQISTGLFADIKNTVQFSAHGTHAYSGSVYIHEFSFLQVADIYEQDTVDFDDSVAFRDIDFKQFRDFGTQTAFMQGTPDLDDIPL